MCGANQIVSEVSIDASDFRQGCEPFACDFTMTPIRNEKSQVVLFLCCYQEICGDLLPPPMHQSMSCFKVNHSKLYSVLSWASELPFSRSYLQMKADNYAGNAENDENSPKRPDSKIDLITTQTTGNSSISCCNAVENHQLLTLPTDTTNQQKTNKHYLDIPTNFNRHTFNNSHELIRQSQLSVNKSSFPNLSEEIQLTGKAHYPAEYYLPSNCQTTQSLDILSNPMFMKSSQQISVTQNTCIARNASILSLPQIKLHLRKISPKKAQIKDNNKNNDESIHEILSNVKSTENMMISSPNDNFNKRSTSESNHISNDVINMTPTENNANNGVWKNANTVPLPNENNPSNIDQPCKEQHHQNEPVFTSETKSAFVTNTNNKTDQSVCDSGDNNHNTGFNCLTCFSGSLSDSQSNIGGSISPGSNEPDPQKYSYKRRKSYAVIHGLTSGGWKSKDSNSGKLNRYKIQKLTKSNFVLLHYGLFRIVWDWLLLLLTFYIAFIVPYNVTFENRSTHSSRCSIIDLIVEIFLIIDVILNFHTTYVSKSGQIINDRQLIAKHYAKGWLILDLLAALPVDFILIFIQSSSLINLEDVYINSRVKHSDNSSIISNYTQEIISSVDGNVYYDSKTFMKFNLISLLQMMKLARLLRLARLIQKITRLSQYSVIVLGLLMFSFALVAHWCACIWYVIGLSEVDGSDIGELNFRKRVYY
ncbi:unnamed protein product [Trichobilharzia regenti]|nr:unnamed protein product [Trichobilharzia regenti]